MVEAGYPDGRDAASGRPLVLNYDYYSQPTPEVKSQLDWMVKQFAKVDIQLEIRATDNNQFQEKVRQGKHQIFWSGWLADYPDADLIIASDGVNSRIRNKYASVFQPDIVTRPNRFIWLGTTKLYDAFNFHFEKTEHGWFQSHVYKFDDQTTTYIVETPEHVWKAHGLDQANTEQSIAFCEKLFAKYLGGHPLLSNARHLRGSAWLNFQRVRCRNWHHFNGKSHVVLMGDAVHTAHFAIGSGTKLALEDAIGLTRLFKEAKAAGGGGAADIPAVLQRYQTEREVDVLRLQNAAWNAMEWFEVVGTRYCDQLEPEQFMYSMLTRSQRISHENLRLRDACWLEGYERWFARRAAVQAGTDVPLSAQEPAASVARDGARLAQAGAGDAMVRCGQRVRVQEAHARDRASVQRRTESAWRRVNVRLDH
jgi:2-polyprenyl-6-methoxyphenol hydroxylase-like FAD-dependent oxidoreductase